MSVATSLPSDMGERLSAGDDRIHTLMFDLRGGGTHRAYRKCADLLRNCTCFVPRASDTN